MATALTYIPQVDGKGDLCRTEGIHLHLAWQQRERGGGGKQGGQVIVRACRRHR